MTIPDYQSLMLPILRTVAQGKEARTGSLKEQMADEFHLSDDERDKLVPSGQKTMIADRTHWAITYLYQAGLLHRVRRGVVEVTPRGKEVLRSNPPKIDVALLEQFAEFSGLQNASSQQGQSCYSIL
jgi:restriction system protein